MCVTGAWGGRGGYESHIHCVICIWSSVRRWREGQHTQTRKNTKTRGAVTQRIEEKREGVLTVRERMLSILLFGCNPGGGCVCGLKLTFFGGDNRTEESLVFFELYFSCELLANLTFASFLINILQCPVLNPIS